MIGCMVLGLLAKFLFARISSIYITTKLKELEAAEKEKSEEFNEQTVKK